MKRQITILLIFLFAALSIHAQQRFYNLTSQDVQIDSVLPSVAYRHDLPLNHADTTYTVVMRYPEYIDMSKKDIEAYRKISGEVLPPSSPVFNTFISYSRKKACLTSTFCPIVYKEGKYKWLVSFMLDVEKTSKRNNTALYIPTFPTQNDSQSILLTKEMPKAMASSNVPEIRYAKHSVLSSGRWAKVQVAETGIHQLTSEVIRRAGFTDLSKVKIYGYGGNLVPESLTDDYLRTHDDLQEVPTCTVNGKRLFYANGPVSWASQSATTRIRNPYHDYGCYFITQTDDEPLTCAEEDLLEIVEKGAERFHSLYEKDEFAWFEGGRNLVEKAKIGNAGRTYKITVPKGNATAKLTASVSSDTSTGYEVLCNDILVGTHTFNLGDYDKCATITDTYTINSPKEENTVTIRSKSNNAVRLDYLAMQFDTPTDMPVLESGEFPAATYVYNITNQDLHADAGFDMVIIIPTAQKTIAQAKRLAEFHEKNDGLKVRIVPADEIYNEFSSGTPDVSAYRRYMKMLYDKESENIAAPRYLLLFGDAAFDNRMLTEAFAKYSPDDFLLCFESENSGNRINSYVCDDFCGMLDDGETIAKGGTYTGIPDVAVGRFPCRNETEAKILVDKTINYASNTTRGNWQNTLVFMGDDGNENTHMRDVNNVAEKVMSEHPGYYVKKIMLDAYQRTVNSNNYRFPEASAQVKQLQSDGVLIMDYAGHANPTTIADEHLVDYTDVVGYTGKNLPLWVTACCDIVPFDGTEDNIGEELILNGKGGAVAFYGTTRTVLASYNNLINREYITNVLNYDAEGKPITIGEAQRLTKKNLVDKGLDFSVNKLQYVLLGDPALRLALPTVDVVIDEVNGHKDFAKETISLKSTDVVKVKGHLERNGEKATDFNGILNSLVRDSRQKVVCRLQNTSADGASKAFEYYDRTKVLFQGKDSIKAGEFEFVFAVPSDVTDSDETGLMTFYALNNARNLSASGAFSNFVVKAGDKHGDDNIGPSLFCYLNRPDFNYGGVVNSTPFFVAELSDKDGINATGAGIGHDLMLTIDNDINMTFNLNSNFQFDFGSYTSGQTYYSLPELSQGKHTLTFTAWDILNNSSTTQLQFYVQRGLTPNIADVSVTRNPASEGTTFIVTHDRKGSNVSMEIEVLDPSGRLLWTKRANGYSTGENFTYDWDLTLDNGKHLGTGVYLYRINLSSDGSSWTSKAKKLIVVNGK